MKKLLMLLTAFALAGCGTNMSSQTTAGAIPTPVVIIQTVLVTQAAPAMPAASEVPQVAPASAATPSTGAIVIPASYYGESFSNITISNNSFSLRCEPKTITFDVTTADANIAQVDMYWRLYEKTSTYIPNWIWARTLQTDGSGHFWISLAGSDIPTDLRPHNGWLDFELIGIDKHREAVGRTEKISKLVTYTIDC